MMPVDKPVQLSADEWRSILERLSEELRKDGRQEPATILTVGGVAVLLGYGGRRTTRDLDFVTHDPRVETRIVNAANRVAAEFGLKAGWLNNEAQKAGFISQNVRGSKVVFQNDALVVCSPDPFQLLATKLPRMVSDADAEDMLTLLRIIERSDDDVENIWNMIGGFIPVAEQEEARYNLDVVWDKLHEPS